MSTLVMSLGMIAFFAVVMAIAWRRYQRHATKAAERSRPPWCNFSSTPRSSPPNLKPRTQNNLPEPSERRSTTAQVNDWHRATASLDALVKTLQTSADRSMREAHTSTHHEITWLS